MSTFLTAEWRKLIMAQYEVAPATLAPYLPTGLELDLFHGRCYVSLVAFLFDRVRLKGIPIPFHTRFEEINLRFYVMRTESDGSRKRGVVFIREFVPRRAIAFVARRFYEEPYTAIPTSHRIESTPSNLYVKYSWNLGSRDHSIAVNGNPTPQPIAPGSKAEFITEHYWGYTKRADGSTSTYEVQHPHWQTYPLTNHAINVDFSTLYGPAFAHLDYAQPASVLLAEGSAVSVHSGFRL
jgi:uncharacterized protein YqjF (DUF2071 family)